MARETASRTSTPAGARTRSGRNAGRTLWLTFLLLPPLAFFCTFVVYPIGSALVYSFFEWEGVGRAGFAGLGNYRRLLFQEPFASWTLNAFGHNVIVFVALMVVQNGVALLLAMLLATEPRGTRIYQVVFFLPVTLALVLVGFQWRLFLNPLFGLVNELFDAVGLEALSQPWLGQADTALGALILVNAWRWLGFPTIVFLAGIRAIPEEYFEAARLDGAGAWHLARFITWPLLAPSVTIIVILTFIGSFNWFDLPYVMAGVDGPPARSTDVLGLYFYRLAFGEVSSGLQNFGMGSALAALMFVFILLVSSVWTRVLRRREERMS